MKNNKHRSISSAALLLLLMAVLLATLSGCGTASKNSGAKKIGLAFPTKDQQRFYLEGLQIATELESHGYEVNLQFANGDVQTQLSQIENLVADNVDVLVIAPIESASLGEALDMAKAHSIPVISYDRLLTNSDAVTYYTTFDNYKVGTMQARYILDTLDLEHTDKVFNIEFTAGDPGDNNAVFFFGGAFDMLKPYIDSGTLNVVSGQVTRDACSTPGWNTEKAQLRAENILSSYYNNKNVDIWVASNDTTSLGVANALANAYEGTYPLLTGQDCDIINIKNIISGRQSMDIIKPATELISATVNMVDEITSGKTVTVNDTTSYDNGAKIVPSFLCTPVTIDVNNYKKYLIDTGIYTEEQLK